jgi:hypothetical protein
MVFEMALLAYIMGIHYHIATNSKCWCSTCMMDIEKEAEDGSIFIKQR